MIRRTIICSSVVAAVNKELHFTDRFAIARLEHIPAMCLASRKA